MIFLFCSTEQLSSRGALAIRANGYKPEVYRSVFVLYDMGCRVYYCVVMYSRTCLKTVAL